MQSIYPYVMVKNAKEAMDYYKEVFGAQFGDIYYGDSIPGMENKPEAKNIIIHATLKIEGNALLLCDAVPDSKDTFFPATMFGNNVQICLMFTSLDKQKAAYDKLVASSAEIIMPLKMSFWGEMYAIVKDKYGVTWQLGYMDPNQKC